MRQADLFSLKDTIQETARTSLGARLKDVTLEADKDEYGSDFLRVLVEMDSFDGISDETMQAVITLIENAVNRLDERFPSVRFADAA